MSARIKLEGKQIEDKLRTLISEYEHHMKVHKIKTVMESLKTIVVTETGLLTASWLTGLGVIPGLMGMAVTPLYAIKQRQIALMEAELKAPGREVAYIVRARHDF